MKNSIQTMLAIILAVLLNQKLIAQTTTSTWTNPKGGDWTDASSWDSTGFPNNMPPTIFDVVIDLDNGGTKYCIQQDPDITVENVTINSADAKLVASGFGFGNGLFVNDGIDLLAGELFLEGNVVGGTVTVHDNGHVNGSGQFNITLLQTSGGRTCFTLFTYSSNSSSTFGSVKVTRLLAPSSISILMCSVSAPSLCK